MKFLLTVIGLGQVRGNYFRVSLMLFLTILSEVLEHLLVCLWFCTSARVFVGLCVCLGRNSVVLSSVLGEFMDAAVNESLDELEVCVVGKRTVQHTRRFHGDLVVKCRACRCTCMRAHIYAQTNTNMLYILASSSA